VALPQFLEISWQSLPFEAIWKLVYVVVGTTFLSYLLNVFALTQLKASTVSAFVYLQPLIGIIFAVMSGKDSLSFAKVVAAVMVLLGVYLVSKRPIRGF
jgi:drug/metabolite transporter (DMT)-like permease